MNADIEYLQVLREVYESQRFKPDRTGTGTWSSFAQLMRFNLQEGFPLLTTKKMSFKLIIKELLWFISGSTNIQPLLQAGVHIWTEWPFKHYHQQQGDWDRLTQLRGSTDWTNAVHAFEQDIVDNDQFAQQWGELGPVYGKQWRAFSGPNGETVDQLHDVIELIKKDPSSRRMVVNSWNAAEIPAMIQSGLPPCHLFFQFYVLDNTLSCAVVMRSADLFLGVPFNIASYAALTHVIADLCGLEVGELALFMVDCHIYVNHEAQVKEQLNRARYLSPMLLLDPLTDINNMKLDNFHLVGYESHPPLIGDIAI
jgi:thymidylate synthase